MMIRISFLILLVTCLTFGFKLIANIKEEQDDNGSKNNRSHVIQRRATQTAEAVLMYSTQDSIYELHFKSVASKIKDSDFRKVFETTKYMIEAFSATYKEGDNLLMYGKKQIYSRSLRLVT